MDTTRLYELIAKEERSESEVLELETLYTQAKIQGIPGLPEMDVHAMAAALGNPQPVEQPQAEVVAEETPAPVEGAEFVSEPMSVEEVVAETEVVAPFEEPVAEAQPEVQPEPEKQLSPAEETLEVSLSTIEALRKQLRLFRELYQEYAHEEISIVENKLKEALMWLQGVRKQ